MTFLQTMRERGFIQGCTDEAALTAHLAEPRVGYIGFDCTATSFHVGTLLPLMMLRHFQAAGHTPIVLMGGGTSMVGDPSGKDATRQILTEADIVRNRVALEAQFARFVDFSTAQMLDNNHWLAPLEFIKFLREVGPHFSVNRMLSMDSVKGRIDREQEMSLLEFNYMVLQSYDFVHLARNHRCTLQMGGSDQWGNIVNGIDLGRRMGTERLFGLTCPLALNAAGEKMGKTAGGAVWLDPTRTSPFEFWQFWRNTDDRDVERFLKLYTIWDLSFIDHLMQNDINEAKVILANSVTELVHGHIGTLFPDFDDSGAPIPPARQHSLARDGDTIAHACVAIGMFPSLSQARRNGWDRPLVLGERLELTKKKIRVDVVA